MSASFKVVLTNIKFDLPLPNMDNSALLLKIVYSNIKFDFALPNMVSSAVL